MSRIVAKSDAVAPDDGAVEIPGNDGSMPASVCQGWRRNALAGDCCSNAAIGTKRWTAVPAKVIQLYTTHLCTIITAAIVETMEVVPDCESDRQYDSLDTQAKLNGVTRCENLFGATHYADFCEEASFRLRGCDCRNGFVTREAYGRRMSLRRFSSGPFDRRQKWKATKQLFP
jgi:hypothetical protein